jgi:hypothetical protein
MIRRSPVASTMIADCDDWAPTTRIAPLASTPACANSARISAAVWSSPSGPQ